MTELWKDVPSYEGIYQVSNQGSVRSLDRLMVCSGSVKGRYTSFKKGILLRPGRMPSGHVSVALGRHNSMCVHTLVLLAFVGAPPPHYECLHDNGIPNDNRLENLRFLCPNCNSQTDTFAGRNKKIPSYNKVKHTIPRKRKFALGDTC